ncbi:MAG: oxidoreductase [Glaciihabitans sp.]|nr:oxidoreductase [Glaciihabitans sp.]
MVRALLVTRAPETAARVELRDDLADADLGDGDVLVDVQWSSVNYKDALALDGNPGVKRIDPLIPGIDLVGTVSSAPAESHVSAGQAVVLNGWGIGETHHGGYSSRARVNADWLIRLPSGLSAARAAAIGTAGFTAALAVIALEKGGIGDGPILVTGASGGVGSIAIALLATAGYEVVAATGRPAQRDYLLALGASDTLARSELESTGRPLQSQRWAGAIDSVGGITLANALAQTKWGGTVAACGLVGGSDLPTTVMPFILRGVVLAGINSVECPRDQRLTAWERLARDLDPVLLDSLTTSIGLAEVPDAAAALLRGEGIGRTVVDVTG